MIDLNFNVSIKYFKIGRQKSSTSIIIVKTKHYIFIFIQIKGVPIIMRILFSLLILCNLPE